MNHRASTLFQRPDQIADPLYVVTPIFNPVRFRSRWRLYEDFAKMVAEAGAILYTVEIAFGERFHSVTDPGNPRHIQLRTPHELWLKENAINVGVSRLPSDWKYVAWIDADTMFVRDDWANETLHRLQHYAAVQMWSQFMDLNANQELIERCGPTHSYAHYWVSGQPSSKNASDYPYYPYKGYPGAPGLAWACTRTAWDTMGGLLDTTILGAGDWYMAHGFVGRMEDVLPVGNRWYHPTYVRRAHEWAERVADLHKNLGVVPGLALHYWHGPKLSRRYHTREKILHDTQFNPDVDVSRDWQGLMQLRTRDERTIQLRNRLREYFAHREEDAI